MSTEFTPGGMRVRGTLIATILLFFVGGASAGINEWTSAGPQGGYAADVAFHTTVSGTLFAASRGRVYQSTNYGESWSRMEPAFHGGAAMLAMDPDDPAEFYAGTYGAVERMPAPRVYTRTPPMLVPPFSANGSPIVVAASDGNTVFATINGRLFRSSDEGQNWEERTVTVNGATAAIGLIATDPLNANVLYGLASQNVIRSADSGASWQVLATAPADATISSMAIDFRNPQRIWLGTWYSGLLFSANGGGTWAPQLPTTHQVTNVQLHPVSADTVFVGTMNGELLRSIDAGANWSVLPVDTGYLIRIRINPRVPNEMAITGWSGVHVSTDSGATWTRRIAGLEATTISDFVRQPGTNRLYFWAAYEAGLHVLGADSQAPERVNEFGFTLLPKQSKLFDRRVAATSSTVFLQLDDRSIARTSSNGSLWQAGGPIDATPNVRIQALEGSKTHAGTVFAGGIGAVYVSIDSGQSWTKRTSGIPADLSVNQLKSSSSGALYLSGATSGSTSTGQLLRSLDNGMNWQPLLTPSAFVSGIVVDPADARTLYVGITDGLMRSTDEGANWSRIALEVGSYSVSDVAIDPTDADVIYLGGNVGLARSVDRGATWTRIGTEIYSSVYPNRVWVDPRQPARVLVATNGTGLEEITFAPDLSVVTGSSVTSVSLGTRVPLTIDVGNTGPWDATGVRLRLEIASPGSGLSVRANGAACTSDGRIATCTLGLVRKGSTIRVEADATSGGTTFQVTASVEGNQPDSKTTNNTAVVSVASPAPSGGSGGGGGGSFGAIGLLFVSALALVRIGSRARWAGNFF